MFTSGGFIGAAGRLAALAAGVPGDGAPALAGGCNIVSRLISPSFSRRARIWPPVRINAAAETF